jgi:hypothetical protein
VGRYFEKGSDSALFFLDPTTERDTSIETLSMR